MVVEPAERVVKLLDEVVRQERSRTSTAYGRGLNLLANAKHPSAAARIEQAMNDRRYDRQDAADAYLALHGIPDAYQVAIGKWGGPGDLGRLAEPVRVYATVHVLYNEVSNGSFGQYFFNSYAEDVKAAVAGLEAIGDKGRAKIVREAMALIGPEGPSPDREKRQEQLEGVSDARLSELSDAFLEDSGGLHALLARYAVRHKARFVEDLPPGGPKQ